MYNHSKRKKEILIAKGTIKAEYVIKNANIVNVFTKEIVPGDIAIEDGTIVGIGSYTGEQEIDIEGKYVCPGLIDAHVHIESSMVTPYGFAKAVLPFGTTTAIADPHEIANVNGLAGIQYMIDEAEKSPMNIYFMLPSCVPAVYFENNGAILNAKDLQKLINHKKVLGLGEVMDYPAVIEANKDIMDKLELAKGKVIDGHSPHLTGKDLNAYKVAGIDTDHECSTGAEAIERLRLGMYVQLREGSAAKNVESILRQLIKEGVSLNHCVFCTDDRHLADIKNEGHIDNIVRKAINLGLNPIDAISIATINAAKCYNLKTKGAVAPLYDADLLIVKDLDNFIVEDVMVAGEWITRKESHVKDLPAINSINIPNISREMFNLNYKNKKVNIIKLINDQIETKLETRIVKSSDDICKIAVIERHKGTGNIGLGLLEGLGFSNGAIAQSIAHDSHNVIVAGDNDDDMAIAANHIKSIGGGITIVSNGDILHFIELPIAGLMSNKDHEYVINNIQKLINIANQMGVPNNIDPFLTLSFMALPVIPSIRITDQGLFNSKTFELIDFIDKDDK